MDNSTKGKLPARITNIEVNIINNQIIPFIEANGRNSVVIIFADFVTNEEILRDITHDVYDLTESNLKIIFHDIEPEVYYFFKSHTWYTVNNPGRQHGIARFKIKSEEAEYIETGNPKYALL